MNARMTLVGMENILQHGPDQARSLADPWEIEGTEFDAQTLLASIIIKGGQMEPLYTDPRFFYTMNNMWWKKWYPTFKYWWVAAEKEYEPLWDRNGYEEINEQTEETGTLDTSTTGKEVMDDDTTGSKTSTEIMDDDTTYSRSGTSTEQLSGKDKTTHDSDRDISVENKVSAFDSNTYQPHDTSHTDDTLNSENTETTYGKKTETTYSENGSGTDDRTTTFSEQTKGTDDRTTTTNGTVDTDTSGNKDFGHQMHQWGNWGISQTEQKLLYSEFEVRFKLNPYELMSDIYLADMAVRVF